MKKLLSILVLSAFAYCGDLNVAVAANVTYPFAELKAKFNETNPDIKIIETFGASGNFNTQIKNGAPFDIFLAANVEFAQDLYNNGFAINEAKIYAKGKLAIFTVRNFDIKNLDILKSKDIKTITIANPKTAPYGEAAIQTFQSLKIYDEIKDKIVEAKSIGEALTQTVSASDIGFVAASALFSPKMQKYRQGVNFVLVDSSLHKPIEQGMVLLKHAKDNKEAQIFYDFLLSDAAKEIFLKYGYEI